MARIMIAGASEASTEHLSRLLAASGFQVFRCCASGGELRRAINEGEDGVVVLMGALPDCRIDEILDDFGDCVQILFMGRPQALEACERPEIFRLPLPASGQTVIGAVEMLSQLHQMRLPKRTGAERQAVEQAKRVLMKKHGITEPEAHRALQQYAMRHGVKMAEWAAQIVSASKRTEE